MFCSNILQFELGLVSQVQIESSTVRFGLFGSLSSHLEFKQAFYGRAMMRKDSHS